MTTNERELRDVILTLVKICKVYKIRALSLNTALMKVAQIPPNKKSELTETDIETFALKAQGKVQELVNAEAARVEASLSGSKPFLKDLRIYVSGRYFDR